MNKKTKIICTMGPASESEEIIKELIINGMDIARLNFSHGTHESHARMISKIKKVREELNIPTAILLDTKGPEIRTGMSENGGTYELFKGQEIVLTTRDVLCNSSEISVTYKELPHDARIGGRILIADGLIELIVKEINGTEIICLVTNGGELSSKKGINLPNARLKLPAITEQDREDILFGIEQGVDFIAASFIRSAEAINEIRSILNEKCSDINIIAKIENMEGVENIDEIIGVSDGVMVARGDLGVELETEELPYLQKEMIIKCNQEFKPVITATQMLDSMIRNPRPTRAEVTDVANAVYDGTDGIMLSGETAMGKYPVESVKMMAKIAIEAEKHVDHSTIEKLYHFSEVDTSGIISNAISYSAVATSERINAKLIVASSFSGHTARLVSKFKPIADIAGLSPLDSSLRKMQLYRGVRPIKVKEVSSTDQLLEEAVRAIMENGLVEKGDIAVLTAGIPVGKTSVTNMIKAVVVE